MLDALCDACERRGHHRSAPQQRRRRRESRGCITPRGATTVLVLVAMIRASCLGAAGDRVVASDCCVRSGATAGACRNRCSGTSATPRRRSRPSPRSVRLGPQQLPTRARRSPPRRRGAPAEPVQPLETDRARVPRSGDVQRDHGRVPRRTGCRVLTGNLTGPRSTHWGRAQFAYHPDETSGCDYGSADAAARRHVGTAPQYMTMKARGCWATA
jgi:hypothetical protein